MPPARSRAAGVAALITLATVCAGDAVARVFPFGPRNRSVNDLGNQFIPFHAHLWDLLHGRADGGLLVNWQSGFGTSFLPDLGTYVSSPFAVLVGVFPRDRIDLAVYVLMLLKTAAAAAAMTWLLIALHKGRGRRWMAGVLGASYALCGWSVLEASYNVMWLDGLIAFPLLCLAGEWARAGRRPLLGPAIVAMAWIGNFYTAYMATLGAALVLAVSLLREPSPARERLGVLVRAARTVLVGVALAAPLLLPVYLGSKLAHPGWTKQFAPVSWTDVFARTLPATYTFATPALFIGGATLLLACALAFNRAVPGRVRWLWTGLTALVTLSLQWGPTHLVWHVFATPNGSPYRQTFVLAGIVVITAWMCLSEGWPDRRALLGGGAVVTAIALAGAGGRPATVFALPLFGIGLAAVVGGLVLARRGQLLAGKATSARRGRHVAAAAFLLTGALVGQAAATTAYADRIRLGRFDDYPPWGEAHTERAAAVVAADGWPAYRTDTGRPQIAGNDPMLIGGQGASYYSSHTPAVLTRTMAALGTGWTSNGRNLQSLDNPVTDAVFSIGARVQAPLGQEPVAERTSVPPLVTVRPPGPSPVYGRSPFRNQELLLGADVYSPAVRGACPVGTEVYLWAPDFTGTARLGSRAGVKLRGGQPKRRAALTPLGTVTTPGARVSYDGGAPRRATVECLDTGRLNAAVAGLKASGAVSVEVLGNGVSAQLPPGTKGRAVFAMPAIEGWSCDGRPAGSYLGLVSVPLDGSRTRIACSFRTPGLTAGSAMGAAGLLALLVLALLTRRHRPKETRPSPVSDVVAAA
ncbi:YfhO family protein [Streptomyces sp. NBC_00390]|uniref:YfhO family protein n=1 Tax=Streptomyces sp. NBC_00390 TaxID=2975736 RepID=UPI002E1E1505